MFNSMFFNPQPFYYYDDEPLYMRGARTGRSRPAPMIDSDEEDSNDCYSRYPVRGNRRGGRSPYVDDDDMINERIRQREAELRLLQEQKARKEREEERRRILEMERQAAREREETLRQQKYEKYLKQQHQQRQRSKRSMWPFTSFDDSASDASGAQRPQQRQQQQYVKPVTKAKKATLHTDTVVKEQPVKAFTESQANATTKVRTTTSRFGLPVDEEPLIVEVDPATNVKPQSVLSLSYSPEDDRVSDTNVSTSRRHIVSPSPTSFHRTDASFETTIEVPEEFSDVSQFTVEVEGNKMKVIGNVKYTCVVPNNATDSDTDDSIVMLEDGMGHDKNNDCEGMNSSCRVLTGSLATPETRRVTFCFETFLSRNAAEYDSECVTKMLVDNHLTVTMYPKALSF